MKGRHKTDESSEGLTAPGSKVMIKMILIVFCMIILLMGKYFKTEENFQKLVAFLIIMVTTFSFSRR